jgi:uncharacterized RDD family membrane protein YckC
MSDSRTLRPVYGPVQHRYGEPPALDPDMITQATIAPATSTPATPVLARLGTHRARWGRRASAHLIDFAPVIVAAIPLAVAYVLALVELARLPVGSEPSRAVGSMPIWAGIGALAMLAALGWTVYNRWLTGGRTGRSLGKRVLRLQLVGESTGEPIDLSNAFVRDLLHILDLVSVVGFLWPLWDGGRQTFADMIVRTVVIDERPPAE